MVEPELVVGVVLLLDLRETIEVGAERATHELLALLAQSREIEVEPAVVGVRLHLLPEVARPADVGRILLGTLPDRMIESM